MQYLPRTLEKHLSAVSAQFPVLLLTGPRQVGKTTLLRKLATPDRREVTLDDHAVRTLAQQDPALFLQRFPPPLLIDEIQYAPELLPYIKMAVDASDKKGLFWLTGSQQFHLMKNITESLAGRVAIVNLLGFSYRERHQLHAPQDDLFSLSSDATAPIELSPLFNDIWRGAFPALATGQVLDRDLFYRSYIQTYLERDVRDLAQVGDQKTFYTFLKVCAARSGQILNLSDLARDTDISVPTAKKYLSILEASFQVILLPSYHGNITKRAIKAPKLYFLDTGLCAYLTGWSTPETLLAGAMNGALFENHVVVEILKRYWSDLKNPALYYYRDKEKSEVDLLLERDGRLHPIEIKLGSTPRADWISGIQKLKNAGLPIGNGLVISLSPRTLPLSSDITVVNVGVI
ncbi:MAG TPA: ATP-binding protein [bacterium]|nr:ATP-binding protein [bacterium]